MPERNEYGQIEFPQWYYRGEYYVDFSTLQELVGGMARSSLHRLLAKMTVPIAEYKNRKYFKTEWALRFWRNVDEQQKNQV